MAECINREKILEDIGTDIAAFTLSMVFRHIHNAPPADVAEVKHGKWVEVYRENIWGDSVHVLECSACGKYTVGTRGIMTKSNYCPNCGAKMDLED